MHSIAIRICQRHRRSTGKKEDKFYENGNKKNKKKTFFSFHFKLVFRDKEDKKDFYMYSSDRLCSNQN